MLLLRILFAVALLTLAACGQPEPPTVGTAQEFAVACDEANEGQRVAVEGYLRLPDSFTGDQSVMLRLYETDAFDGPPIGVSTRIGSEANQMAMVPLEYTDDDLSITLADGQVAGYGTRVRISGKMYYPLVEQDFACGLENPLIELAG